MRRLFFLGLIISLFLVNCTEDDLPNPYDGVNYGDTPLVIDTVSDSSFVKIHRDILFPSCSSLGCHDGTTPPDFRTVESAYNTLVYHPIVKPNSEFAFTYRVVPKDTASSVLHERLTNCCYEQNENNRMPLQKPPLPQEDLDNIANWILEGAKDINGNIPAEPPNTPPRVHWYVVVNAPPYDTIYGEWGDRRNNADSLFSIPSNQYVHFMFRLKDYGADKTKAQDMTINELEISKDIDFSAPFFTYAAEYHKENALDTLGMGDLTPAVNGSFWIAEVPTSALPSGTYFMRYRFSDGETTVVFPNNESDNLDKINWSFTVQ